MADLDRFLVDLRAADAVLAGERMDAKAVRRVARRIAAGQRARTRWWRPYIPALCFAAGAVLVMIVMTFGARGRLALREPDERSQSELSMPAQECEGEATPRVQVPEPPPPAELPRAITPPSASVQTPTMRPSPRRRVEPAKPIASAAAPDPIEALLAELRALRRAGRYVEAERRLEGALAEPWTARAREVLHYELGTIVERHTGDADRACALWREHLARFPKTRYAAAIADARRRLGCE
jgi:hypothetical protein